MDRIRRQYTHEGISTLPDTVGVYILRRNGSNAYVGKSIHVRTRVFEHLRDGKHAEWVTMLPTENEAEAFALEKELVGSICPKENELLKQGCQVEGLWDRTLSAIGFN